MKIYILTKTISNLIKKSFFEKTEITMHNVFAASVVGSSAHFFLYFIHKYLFGLEESIYMRIIAFCLCLSVAIYPKISSPQIKIFFSYYWHFMLAVALPLTISYLTILNHFNDMWLWWMIFMPMALAIFVPNWLWYIIDLSVGILMACLLYYATDGGPILVNNVGFEPVSFILVFSFTAIAGILFVNGNRGSWLAKQAIQHKQLTAIAGSIAHEMRNPISAIRLSSQTLPEIKDVKRIDLITTEDLQSIKDHKDVVNKTSKLANEIMDMTLLQLSGKKISKEDFVYLDARENVEDAANIYGYKSSEERKRIKIEIKDNFTIHAIETTFKYILFNLIKNALYYVKDKPDLTITISSFSELGSKILIQTKNKKTSKKKSKLYSKSYHSDHLKLNPDLKYNVISITDTGPGIPPEILDQLFGSFVTSGKKEGTGLGLTFCKRTMIDFGGDIDCESEPGEWTRFNLFFPVLNDEELQEAKKLFSKKDEGQSKDSNEAKAEAMLKEDQIFKKLDLSSLNLANKLKKVLIVDDQEINLKISQKIVTQLLPNALIDMAPDGKQALHAVKKNKKERTEKFNLAIAKIDNRKILAKKFKGYKYDLIITDIQMPKMDGFQFTKAVRKFDKNIPICAYTSRASYKIKQKAIEVGIDDYIMKPIPNRGMHKAIYKWLVNSHNYNFDLEQITKNLGNLKILIADDEMVNIMVMKRFLSKYEITIEAVGDGQSLIEKYKAQFDPKEVKKFEDNNNPHHIDPTLINHYDIIIADINMPIKRGDEAAKEIRNFELIHSVQNKAIIIGNSGDGQEENLKSMLKSGMDDYFIKGQDNNRLLQIIYFWQKFYKGRMDPKYINIDNKEYNNEDTQKEQPILNQKLSPEDLKELRDMFIESATNLFKKIKIAVKKRKIKDLAFQTHALKGVAGNIGAQKLFIYISMLNNYARKDQWPTEENWLENLEEIVNKTLKKFEEIK